MGSDPPFPRLCAVATAEMGPAAGIDVTEKALAWRGCGHRRRPPPRPVPLAPSSPVPARERRGAGGGSGTLTPRPPPFPYRRCDLLDGSTRSACDFAPAGRMRGGAGGVGEEAVTGGLVRWKIPLLPPPRPRPTPAPHPRPQASGPVAARGGPGSLAGLSRVFTGELRSTGSTEAAPARTVARRGRWLGLFLGAPATRRGTAGALAAALGPGTPWFGSPLTGTCRWTPAPALPAGRALQAPRLVGPVVPRGPRGRGGPSRCRRRLARGGSDGGSGCHPNPGPPPVTALGVRRAPGCPRRVPRPCHPPPRPPEPRRRALASPNPAPAANPA